VPIVFGGIPDIEADEKLRAKNLGDIFIVICEAKDKSKNINQGFGSRSIGLEVSFIRFY
jgi:hypothetical protein